jgi:hypothetical protein
MVPERVPSQFGDEPMVLVQILSMMGEDKVGAKFSAQLMHVVFDFTPEIGKKAVFEIFNQYSPSHRASQKRVRATSRLPCSLCRCTQDNPLNDDFATVLFDEF